MAVKSVLVELLVPPANLVLLCAAGLALGLRASRTGRVLTTTGVCGLFVLAMPITGALLFAGLERDLPLVPPPTDPPGAIVILTGDEAHGDGLSADVSSVGPLSLERLRTAAIFHRRAPLPVLITGGRLHPGEPPLAVILARSLADDFGVPTTWLETGSHDTWQSAAHTADMLRAQHIDSVYLVTHGWHMRRSLIAFSHFGIKATAVPVRIDGLESWGALDFLPTARGWLRSYYGLHEWIGCAYYALR